MSRKLIFLVSLVLALSLAGNTQGAVLTWTNNGPDQLWSTIGNWSDPNVIPTDGDTARASGVPGAIIANEGAMANFVFVQFLDGTGELTVDGGTLTCGLLEVGGRRGGSQGTLYMNSGTITCDRLYVNRSGIMGLVNLHGGTIYASTFENLGGDGNLGILDVAGGKLVLDGSGGTNSDEDDFATVQGYIDSNDPNTMVFAYAKDPSATSYGYSENAVSHGQLSLVYDAASDQTILTAIHNLIPSPIDDGIVQPGEVELSWTLPEPDVPGTPMPVNVYFTDDYQALKNFTDPDAMRIVTKENDATSVVVQTESKKRYYWAIDVDANGDGAVTPDEYGSIFSFLADNAPPEVFAGGRIDTRLIDGTRTGPIKGEVTDDGGSYTVLWSIVEQPSDADNTIPGAVIADPTALETTITVSAEGTYVLKLAADDGEYTGEDKLIINVISDDWPE